LVSWSGDLAADTNDDQMLAMANTPCIMNPLQTCSTTWHGTARHSIA
jgi:hypothetical protein